MSFAITSIIAFVVFSGATVGWLTGWLSATEFFASSAGIFLIFGVLDALNHRSVTQDLIGFSVNALCAMCGGDNDKPRRRRRDLARKARLRVFGPGFVPAPLKTGA